MKLDQFTEKGTPGPPDTFEMTGNCKELDVEDIDPNL